MKPRIFAALLLASATAASIVIPARAQSAGQATFKSGVDLVRLDIRVVDANGRPITDLRPEELSVIEDGAVRPLVLFQRVTEPAGEYVDAALKAVSAEVSSNDAFPRGHLYILIFDQQHITPGNAQRARLAAEEFIRTRVRPSDRVALYAVPGPGPRLGFTADKTRALAELANIRGAYSRTMATPLGTLSIFEAHRISEGDEGLTVRVMERLAREGAGAAGEDPAMARVLIRESARSVVNQSDALSRQFLQRLADVVEAFRDIEGRKSVILFSEGFFQDNLSRELEAVAAAAAQSYAVFYTFDLNRRGPSLTETTMSETTDATEVHARIAPLSTLAVETDGLMFLDAGSRSGDALNRIADAAQDYYMVGFTPSADARTNRGDYQRLSFKVSRPGATVSARTGYVLKPEAPPADRSRAISAVLGAPFVQQGLKVDYTTYVLKGDQPGQQRVVLSLNADLPVRSALGDTADVIFVVRNTRDGRVASGADTIALPARPREGAQMGRGAWRVHFAVPPGEYVMRAVVREPGGLAGSANRRVEVKALDGPELTVSDLVLGSTVSALPVRAEAYTQDGLSALIVAYGRTSVQLEGLDAVLELRRQDGTASVTVVPGTLLPAEEDGTGMRRRASFLMPLASVAPGSYLAHAMVRARGEVVAERARHVDVLPGTAPAAAPETLTVAPIEIVRGQLARRYIASLADRAASTAAAGVATRARANQWELVEAEAARVIAAKPDAPAAGVAHALRGLALFVREDYTGAAASLDQALAVEPDNALTAFFLGWARDGARDSKAALSAWRQSAFLDPTNVSAHLALADGYMKLAQPALAAQALRAGLTALPNSPELQERLRQIERKDADQ